MDNGKKSRLLIVDDDTENLLALTEILQSDYTICTVKDGEEALTKARQIPPDLILLDIILPGIDGYETFTKLRELRETKNVPIVFITRLNESSSEVKAYRLGVVDYITKPFNPEIVKLKISHQIEVINLQRALADAAETAKKTSEAKSVFLANMSHEMRTPMNVIVGFTDLMIEEDDPVNLKEALRKINVAGNTLMGIINNVLDISKVEAGKLELTPVQYDVASLLNDIVTLNIIHIGDKPISFKLDINGNLPSCLLGDDLRIKQILNNLLSNAFKYTKEGTVTLQIRNEEVPPAVWVTFTISDTGIGIHEEDIEKLFSDYSQVDTRANREITGTGLGLSITQKIVELMDGEITVESEYGKGTTFRVRICQGFVDEKTIGKETAENLCGLRYSDKKRSMGKIARPDLSYARVLLVDDFPANFDVAVEMLRKYKMQVDCVTSGREAVDRIAAGKPVYNAVFMDHIMPEMDGVEATKLIRALGTKYAENIPIIALTANALAENERMFLDNGFNSFIPKPYSMKMLDVVVRRWVKTNEK
jgi:signal transduction histidine kinase